MIIESCQSAAFNPSSKFLTRCFLFNNYSSGKEGGKEREKERGKRRNFHESERRNEIVIT